MKKIMFLMLLLLLIPIVFSIKEKESLTIWYNFTGILYVDYAEARSFYLNYTAYVVPQDVEVIEESLKNAEIAKDGESFLTKAFEEEMDEIEWGLIQKFKTKRNIYKLPSLPEFPYDVEKYPEDLSKYLEFYNYTNINDEIRNKASEVTSGSSNYMGAVQRILEWVSQNIEYSNTTDTLESIKKATWVFENKRGVCDEFSTLAISLLRSLGMPARYVYGYAWSNLYYDFGPHAWIEIWVPDYGWIYGDPTYGQFGWVDSGHIRFYSSEETTGAVLSVIFNQGMEISSKIPNYVLGEPSKEVLAILDSENETKMFSGSLELSKETAGNDDYVCLKLNLNNPNNNYVPLTLYTVKTGEIKFVDGDSYKGILLKPGQNTYYVLVKTPGTGDAIHPFTVYVPLFGEYSKNLTVLSSEPKTSLEQAKLEISSEKQEFKELKIKSINVTKILYEGLLEINMIVRNTGNTEITDLSVEIYSEAFNGISYELDKLRINEEKEINLKINTNLEPGEKEIDFYFTFANKTKKTKASFIIAEKPEIKIKYLGEKEFPENEDVNFKLIINNTKNVFLSNLTLNVFLKEGNLTKTYYPEKASIILPIVLQEEFFDFGDNSLKIKIIYYDKYGLEGEVQDEYIVTRKPTELLTILIIKIEAFFGYIINFFKNLFSV